MRHAGVQLRPIHTCKISQIEEEATVGRLSVSLSPSGSLRTLARIQRWQEFPERNSRGQAKKWSSGFGACTWSISEQWGYGKSPDSALETMQVARVLLQRWWQRRKTCPFWAFGDTPLRLSSDRESVPCLLSCRCHQLKAHKHCSRNFQVLVYNNAWVPIARSRKLSSFAQSCSSASWSVQFCTGDGTWRCVD
jgi:hypothetical protein